MKRKIGRPLRHNRLIAIVINAKVNGKITKGTVSLRKFDHRGNCPWLGGFYYSLDLVLLTTFFAHYMLYSFIDKQKKLDNNRHDNVINNYDIWMSSLST